MEQCSACGGAIPDSAAAYVLNGGAACEQCYRTSAKTGNSQTEVRLRHPYILITMALGIPAVVGSILLAAAFMIYFHTPAFMAIPFQKPDLVFSSSVLITEYGQDATAVVVTNHGQSPVVIQRVVYNGDHDAVPSWNKGYYVDDSVKFPITLTIGGQQEFMWSNIADIPAAYHKVIIYIDVYTDKGIFTYRNLGL